MGVVIVVLMGCGCCGLACGYQWFACPEAAFVAITASNITCAPTQRAARQERRRRRQQAQKGKLDPEVVKRAHLTDQDLVR